MRRMRGAGTCWIRNVCFGASVKAEVQRAIICLSGSVVVLRYDGENVVGDQAEGAVI